MDADEHLKSHIIKSVINRRYPDFLKWKKPVLFEGIGPYHPSVFDEFDANVQATLETSFETLKEKSLKELEEQFDHAGWPHQHANGLSDRVLKKHDDRMRATKPVWFAGGFNVQGREADYKHWIRMKRWNLHEVIALSIGFEPCGDIFEKRMGRSCQADVGNFYLKRLALLQDNFDWASPQWEGKQDVEVLCSWMRDIELDIPEGFLAEAGRVFGWKLSPGDRNVMPTKPTDPRERKAMLRLILGLAMGGYSYDPKAQRSVIPTEISGDLDRLGLTLSLDTIRKYLNEAQHLLPPETMSDEDA